MTRPKILTALLTAGMLAGMTGVGAAAVTQTNNQSSTTNQSIEQSGGGGVVIGGGSQEAENNSSTELSNTQCIGSATCATYGGPGVAIILGGLTQGNTQTASTTQQIEQNNGGGSLVLFGGSQDAENNSDTEVSNFQLVFNDLGIIIF